MTVYLGSQGEIELRRIFNSENIVTKIKNSSVNVAGKRFSFGKLGEDIDADGNPTKTGLDHGQLLTGDEVEIKSTDGHANGLNFINGYTQSKVKKFIHIDELDGIRLYDSFAHAVTGGVANAIALAAPGRNIDVRVTVASKSPKLLAQVNSYEINTERETADTTGLSEEYRTRVNTLISGSGRISAFWEYTGNTAEELPMYLYELAHRTQVGSNFIGRFYLKKAGYNPSGVSERNNDEIWWRVEGIITAAAIQFAIDNTVQITADFVTTGELRLRLVTEPQTNLLQEDTGNLRLDQDGGAKLGLQQST